MNRKRLSDPFIYWVRERESIRLKKAQGLPQPWTDDPILRQFRFCNVRRRDDRVSTWLEGHLLQFQPDFEPSVFYRWSALARWINWPPTIEAILDVGDLVTYNTIDLRGIGKLIEKIEGKAWTGAYMVRAAPIKQYGTITKGEFVCEIVVGRTFDFIEPLITEALKCNQIKPVWHALQSALNWGSFMAGQVVADWTYTPLLEKAYDLKCWAPMGPGSIRGYNRLLGRYLTERPDEGEWCARLMEWRARIIDALGPEYVDVTLHDVQNCLCEVDKYLRVREGEGRPRSTYKPETAYDVI